MISCTLSKVRTKDATIKWRWIVMMMMINDEGGNDSDLMLKLILRDLHTC